MECFCEGMVTKDIRIEADFSADPIWCNKCSCNLDLDMFPISENLKNEFINWILKYGEWIDLGNDTLVQDGVQLEKRHNEWGTQLSEQLKEEVGNSYKVIFIPSLTTQYYLTE